MNDDQRASSSRADQHAQPPSSCSALRHRPQLPAGPDDAAGAARQSICRLAPASWSLWSGRPAPASRRLLHIAGLLERPDRRRGVPRRRRPAARLDDDRRTAIRRTNIGFVYQYHHLLPEFSAEENVMLPQMIAGHGRRASGRPAPASCSAASGSADRLASPAGPALRRRAAARGDRPRARQRAEDRAGRRADRQSRSGHRRARCSTCSCASPATPASPR